MGPLREEEDKDLRPRLELDGSSDKNWTIAAAAGGVCGFVKLSNQF